MPKKQRRTEEEKKQLEEEAERREQERREKEIKERNRAWKLFLSAIEDDVQPAITEVLEYINRSI
ncbi:MAG: hypothetical protein LBI86_06495, partial [Treponema sp.]|nr:hypothetical protein [Treponema sp.]